MRHKLITKQKDCYKHSTDHTVSTSLVWCYEKLRLVNAIVDQSLTIWTKLSILNRPDGSPDLSWTALSAAEFQFSFLRWFEINLPRAGHCNNIENGTMWVFGHNNKHLEINSRGTVLINALRAENSTLIYRSWCLSAASCTHAAALFNFMVLRALRAAAPAWSWQDWCSPTATGRMCMCVSERWKLVREEHARAQSLYGFFRAKWVLRYDNLHRGNYCLSSHSQTLPTRWNRVVTLTDTTAFRRGLGTEFQSLWMTLRNSTTDWKTTSTVEVSHCTLCFFPLAFNEQSVAALQCSGVWWGLVAYLGKRRWWQRKTASIDFRCSCSEYAVEAAPSKIIPRDIIRNTKKGWVLVGY